LNVFDGTVDDERNHEIDGSESDDRVVDSLRHIMSTQPLALKVCLGALLAYLKDFGLDILFKLDCNFRPFVNRNHMKLDGNTLNNLELLRNQSNAQERGSLLWILDHTHTPFGKRLLINWIKQPLIDPAYSSLSYSFSSFSFTRSVCQSFDILFYFV
jgi:DNA mismatch repair ATPase MutS